MTRPGSSYTNTNRPLLSHTDTNTQTNRPVPSQTDTNANTLTHRPVPSHAYTNANAQTHRPGPSHTDTSANINANTHTNEPELSHTYAKTQTNGQTYLNIQSGQTGENLEQTNRNSQIENTAHRNRQTIMETPAWTESDDILQADTNTNNRRQTTKRPRQANEHLYARKTKKVSPWDSGADYFAFMKARQFNLTEQQMQTEKLKQKTERMLQATQRLQQQSLSKRHILLDLLIAEKKSWLESAGISTADREIIEPATDRGVIFLGLHFFYEIYILL